MEPNVLYSINEQSVAVLTLNRPQAANALSLGLLDDFQRILRDIRSNPAVRCVIITGKGDRTFCAGADLKERARMSQTEAKQAVSLIQRVVSETEKLPQPVIASLNGSALGGGWSLHWRATSGSQPNILNSASRNNARNHSRGRRDTAAAPLDRQGKGERNDLYRLPHQRRRSAKDQPG